jgi:hypothetical protein
MRHVLAVHVRPNHRGVLGVPPETDLESHPVPLAPGDDQVRMDGVMVRVGELDGRPHPVLVLKALLHTTRLVGQSDPDPAVEVRVIPQAVPGIGDGESRGTEDGRVRPERHGQTGRPGLVGHGGPGHGRAPPELLPVDLPV